MPSHRIIESYFSEQFCREQLLLMRSKTAMAAGGTQAANSTDRSIRRSEVGWPKESELITILSVEAAREINRKTWNFDLDDGMEAGEYQLTHYEAGSEGAYHTHVDMSFDGGVAAKRKLSFIVQLSSGADYHGGDLTLSHVDSPNVGAARKIGTLIVFPAFVPHSVGPLVRGERWSLVSWISGPRFR